MKKNLISVAVAASVLGGAAVQAGQHVNPEGTGQVLMFPFYNADNGNATNMHIVNTTSEAKALKVRFVEYKNSDEVLDFNLYLSGNDHFAFGVIKDPNGTGAALITQDNSCTVPALGSANPPFSGTATTEANGAVTRIQPFTNFLYATSKDVDSSIERTLTGHVEVIEMGELQNVGTPTVTTPQPNNTQWRSFATHGATGVPANCAGLVAGWTAAKTINGFGYSNNVDVTAPKGGLYGLSYHINVASAAAFGFEPTAVDDWQTVAQHESPGSELPSVMQGQPAVTLKTDDALLWETYTLAANSGGTVDQAQAISAILSTTSISNDVMINPAIGGMTDWVITFPTKRTHVDNTGSTNAIAPFTDLWAGSTAGPTTGSLIEKPACEPLTIMQYNREEAGLAGGGPGFSPSLTAATDEICNEVAVVAMGAAGTASALSVTTGLTNLSTPYAEGWQTFSFGQEMANGTLKTKGLPAIGFAAYKVSNGAMSYGNASEHKTASNNSIQ